MKNLLFVLLLVAAGLWSSTCNAQIGRLHLSPVQTIQQNIAKTDITVNYSRPAMRDRVIFGGLVPYDQMWRTGANRNTKIEISADVLIQGQELKKGEYAIFTKPGKSSWEIFFYNETTHWEVPEGEEWDEEKVVVKISVPSIKTETTVQSFTISIDDITNNHFNLSLSWENTKVQIPIDLKTEETMMATIEDALNGPDANDYFSAARYRHESGKDLEQALAWCEKGIEIREEPVWWEYSQKCDILLKMNRSNAEILPFAEKALEIARKKESNYGINAMTEMVAKLKK